MYRFALVFALAACGSPTPTPQPPQQPPIVQPPTTPPASKAAKSIGVATMLPDGTLQLQLRAEGEGGMIGEALISYPPTHAQYKYILDHLGPMKPGDSKSVPPFPDEPKN